MPRKSHACSVMWSFPLLRPGRQGRHRGSWAGRSTGLPDSLTRAGDLQLAAPVHGGGGAPAAIGRAPSSLRLRLSRRRRRVVDAGVGVFDLVGPRGRPGTVPSASFGPKLEDHRVRFPTSSGSKTSDEYTFDPVGLGPVEGCAYGPELAAVPARTSSSPSSPGDCTSPRRAPSSSTTASGPNFDRPRAFA